MESKGLISNSNIIETKSYCNYIRRDMSRHFKGRGVRSGNHKRTNNKERN